MAASPQREGAQAGSVARVLLDSSSSLQSAHEVNSVHANYTAHIENIEMYVFLSSPGITLTAGTQFMLDCLLITSADTDSTDWIEDAIIRGEEHMASFVPQE